MQELAVLLADPAFARSPKMVRLLEYLVSASARGEGAQLKSYTVAVDGLGKSPDFDPQVDSYARVSVARLRRALDNYYAHAEADHPYRLTIDNGTYEVRLVERDRPGTVKDDVDLRGRATTRRQFTIALVIAVIVATMVFGQYLRQQGQEDRKLWQTSDFPNVDVVVAPATRFRLGEEHANELVDRLKDKLARYEGIRVRSIASGNTDYEIRLEAKQSAEGAAVQYSVIDRVRQHYLGSSQVAIESAAIADPEKWDSALSDLAFKVASMTGTIHQNGRRTSRSLDSPETPYGCWLRFSGRLANSLTMEDHELIDCARDWHEAMPDHPLASTLLGWSMVDRSISRVSQSQRMKSLYDGTRILEQAAMLNPDSCMLHVALMRAYTYMGDQPAMQERAKRAMACNPGNLDIKGALGTYLVMWNHESGVALLEEALARHPNPSAWYQVGMFISAMMHEDTGRAGLAVKRLHAISNSTALFHVMTAAYLERMGQRDKARKAWDRAGELQPMLKLRAKVVLDRLPFAPEVRARLHKWLGPLP